MSLNLALHKENNIKKRNAFGWDPFESQINTNGVFDLPYMDSWAFC